MKTGGRAFHFVLLLITMGTVLRFGPSDPGPAAFAWAFPPAPEGVRSGGREAPHYGVRVVHAHPHDPEAFTQGLFYAGGRLYESTGLYGKSSLREVDLVSGRILRIRSLSPEIFGEGIAHCRGRIVQLSWREQVGFVYDLKTFRLLDRFFYAGEGWGITCDGRHLIVSDGTARLRFLDSDTRHPVKVLTVTDHDGRPVPFLNELECVAGEIFANIWKSRTIARICPETGRVAGWIHLDNLDRGRSTEGANGIAYDEAGGRLFVTGKNWPFVYEVVLIPRARPPGEGRRGEAVS